MIDVPFSRFKRLIRIAEVFTVSELWLAFYLAVRVARGEPPFWFDGTAHIILMGGIFCCFGLAAALGGELSYVLHGPLEGMRRRGLRLEEIRMLVRWSPSSLRIGLPLGFLLCFGGAVAARSTDFSDPLSRGAALGWIAGASGFFLMALPVIASAARMPGSYRDKVAVLRPESDRADFTG